MKQNGQIILILILIMSVAVGVGLSVIQRSLSDISTSTKVEQSARAFSAAEAGIERLLKDNSFTGGISVGNAQITQAKSTRVPGNGEALEYPPLKKEEVAQVWLAEPSNLNQVYNASTLDVFWGNPNSNENVAIAITVVYLDSDGKYKVKGYFFDKVDRQNGFQVVCNSDPRYKCKATIDNLPTGSSTQIMLRARLLYNEEAHPLAVAPTSGTLPEQGNLYTSTGEADGSTRTVKVLTIDKVSPFYFNYAVFSLGDIEK